MLWGGVIRLGGLVLGARRCGAVLWDGVEWGRRGATYSSWSSMSACVPSALDVHLGAAVAVAVAVAGVWWESEEEAEEAERRKTMATSLVLPVRVERRSMRARVWARVGSCREVGVRRRRCRYL